MVLVQDIHYLIVDLGLQEATESGVDMRREGEARHPMGK